MTEEGIVQKVFKRWIDYALSGQHDLIPRNSFELREIQQELIEAIKQELNKNEYWHWSDILTHRSDELRKSLIGDTK